MLYQKQKQAIESDDWDTALKIEQLIHAQIDREIKLSQLGKNEADIKVAESAAIKNMADAQKAMRDRQFSIATLFGTIVTAVVAIYGVLKGFFK